ncbi:HNH endonuclease [Pseudoalteromonas sp.]|uniref:HNH endonuclease n=1 Tax=Pseudoalteromonas sp. TaxID=53249 RepID=UPI0023579777|nr:HNH endonuclease [Pseudoalteromonas sp.]
MIPDGIEERHLSLAIKYIEKNGVPEARKSVHYDYLFNEKRYPPKLVISLAAKYAFGEEIPSVDFNAVRARDYLRARGHVVIDRRDEALNDIVSDDDESSFPEGKLKFQKHYARERDSSITRKAKAKRLAETGKLSCDVCSFDFLDAYGELGHGFIEAHHMLPVSELTGSTKTKIKDLALVCSNCHRMLHRQKKVISISKLKSIMNFA